MDGEMIKRSYQGVTILQREDGYMNLTAMCQANGKRIGDYLRLENTQQFLGELSTSVGFPIDQLVQKKSTGPNEERGSWGMEEVAYHCGQWCSPAFAVQVSRWIKELARTGRVDLTGATSNNPRFEALMLQLLETTAAQNRAILAHLESAPALACPTGPLFGIRGRIHEKFGTAPERVRKRIVERFTSWLIQNRIFPVRVPADSNGPLMADQIHQPKLDEMIDAEIRKAGPPGPSLLDAV